MLVPFRNEPMTDFSNPTNIKAFEAALSKVESWLGRTYPIVIGGEKIYTDETFDSLNPANPSQVVARFARATPEHANRAVEVAHDAFHEWRKTPYEARARYLFKLAELIRKRKHEFSAIMVYEVGKSWPEADADTAETIDFCDYYGRQMLRLGGGQPVEASAGRDAELRYIPLGVGVVIPPWNFPGAIMAGMTTASLVAGNSVVLKPASTSPWIAWFLSEMLYEDLRLPPGVLNFLPGPGGKMGDALVDHPLTRFIAFTGSKEIGLRIFQRAAVQQPGQKWLKRTLLEMGGKDAILVDESADLDAAAQAIVASAFGFQGQKCSACSRAILVEDVYDEVVDKVVRQAEKITVGPTIDPSHWMGPVVDAKAYAKMWEYIEAGTQEGKLLLGGQPLSHNPTNGYFVPPTIFGEIDRHARLAQEEIFGPVLACIKAQSFEDGLDVANGTEYGLTGAIFSRHRARLERAREDFHVGNLYFNRKCTGALVGVEPFGGFNMSGTDSKAGGADYLLLFTQAKVISEAI